MQCDTIGDQYRHLVGDYPIAFKSLFNGCAPSLSFRVYKVFAGEWPDSPAACDAYLITGARDSVFDDTDWIYQLSAFVRQLYVEERKVVGICFGHQLIAHALGGKVVRASNGWGVGVQSATLYQTCGWMQPDLRSYRLVYSHQDQVVQLPESAEILGATAHCPIAMFSAGNRMLGIQGHPEFSREFAAALMDAREHLIGPEIIEAARATLDDPTDESIIAQWIAAFLA